MDRGEKGKGGTQLIRWADRNAVIQGLSVIVLTASIVVGGCQKTNTPAANSNTPPQGAAQTEMPPNHPPLQGMSGMTDASGPTDDNEIPLKLTGLNSVEELNRGLAKLNDSALKADYEKAFRDSFSAKQAHRNYPESVELANKVIAAHPDFASAYRVLGYALFNTGQPSQSLDAYKKAVEIDPNYGEAHYALAFMYAMGDQASGKEHFRKAMELGIPDERDLGNRFYSGQ
jgi:tetratricopeptide (TPR) repeat protein